MDYSSINPLIVPGCPMAVSACVLVPENTPTNLASPANNFIFFIFRKNTSEAENINSGMIEINF